MIMLAIIALVLTIVGYTCLFCNKLGISFICFFLVICIWVGAKIYNGSKEIENIPTALDVYRGKTTLEITYRDNVAVDSVVVYKVR